MAWEILQVEHHGINDHEYNEEITTIVDYIADEADAMLKVQRLNQEQGIDAYFPHSDEIQYQRYFVAKEIED